MLLTALTKSCDSQQQIDSATAAVIVTAALCQKLQPSAAPRLPWFSTHQIHSQSNLPTNTPSCKVHFLSREEMPCAALPTSGRVTGTELKPLAAKTALPRIANESPKIKLSQPEYAYHVLVQTYTLRLALAWKEKQTFTSKVQQKCLCRNGVSKSMSSGLIKHASRARLWPSSCKKNLSPLSRNVTLILF